MTSRIAVVPARGGSKRIANKNIRDFCGKPMVAHILDTARESGLFDVIHVSTESATIQGIVGDLGFRVDFLRPFELADDHTPIMPVLKHVADTFASRGQTFDQVWLLMACAPLIEARDLQEAAKLFGRFGPEDSLLAVTEYPAPVEWAFSRSKDGRLAPAHPGMFATRSQDLEKKYFDSGSFAAYSSATVRASQGAGSDSSFVGFVLPNSRCVDIDEEDDWMLAEALYRLKSA